MPGIIFLHLLAAVLCHRFNQTVQVCTLGRKNKGDDACRGDSGGPLLCESTSETMSDEDVRIVGGTNAERGEFKFMVSIQRNAYHMCGGTLISSKKVLTAAHCVIDATKYIGGTASNIRPKLDIEDMSLLAGETSLVRLQCPYQRRKVLSSDYHPKAKREFTGWVYDLGIMVANLPFVITSEGIKPIAIPTGVDGLELSEQYALCQTMGWGTAALGGSSNPNLQKVTLELLPRDICAKLIRKAQSKPFAKWRFNERVQLCTIGTKGKEDTCTGDSGGPLLCDTGSKGKNEGTESYALVGTCSWGLGCGNPDVPGIYARVDVAMNWIKQNLQEERMKPLGNDRNRHTTLIPTKTIVVCAFIIIALL